jgi:hypothetical protein
MTKPEFKQFFENFRGKDTRSSPLGQNLDAAIEFLNLERLPNGTLRARQGLKICSQPLHIYSIHPYIYSDSNNQIQEELIGVATFDNVSSGKYMALVKYASYSLTITRAGGGASDDWTASITNSTSGFVFTLVDNGVTLLTTNLGTGYLSSEKTLQGLADDITALTHYTASVDKTAIADGTQAGVTAITVDSGHTFGANSKEMIYLVDTTVGQPKQRIAEILSTTGTVITLADDPFHPTISVADNQIIGHGGYPAAILELGTVSETGNTSTSISYSVWEPIRGKQAELHLGDPLENFDNDRYHPHVSFENKRNCCYFTAPYLKRITNQVIHNVGEFKYEAGLWKYDGLRYYLSGQITEAGEPITAADAGSGTGLAVGTYKYSTSVKWTDYQGNEFEYFHPAEATVTLAAAKDVSVTSADYNVSNYYFNYIYAALTAGTTTSNLLTITSGHKFRIGDYAYFQDDITNSLVKRRVTASTTTSIEVDGDAVTVANGAKISNHAYRVWRTKANGGTPYLALEGAYYYGLLILTDNVPDASLGIIKSSVQPINIQSPFPRGRAIAEHQGVITLASGQTVYWEDADSPEFSPPAVSNTDIPTETSGEISSLLTVRDGSLYSFKKTSVYQISGSMPENEVEVSKVSENSYGVDNPIAIKMVEDVLIGISSLGIFAHRSDEFVRGFGKELANIVLASSGFQYTFSKAIVFHDSIKNWVHVYFPFEQNTTVDYWDIESDYSKYYVYMISDTEEQASCWSEFYHNKKRLPNRGMAIVNNTFYQQTSGSFSGTGQSDINIVGFLHKRMDSNSLSDYLDNTESYLWAYISGWDDAGEPKTSKFWNDFALYSVRPTDGILPVLDFPFDAFTVEFESYRDWDLTKIDTQRASSLVFSDITDKEKILQLDKGYKAQRRSFKLSGTVNKNPPLISGYEYTVDEKAYKADRMVKNE